MPTRSSERWIADGANVKEQLEALGYEVDLQYAEDDIPTQVNQLDNMITQGAKLLVIASIDGTALTSQLEAAAENNIPVIAYDRLIRDSEHVDYYATFDNLDRKSTRLNSSHVAISYAVFCLKKKKKA